MAEFMPAKYAIDDGEHLVFANPFIAEQCVNIADDDYRENIFFEITPDLKEFWLRR
ncbi:MAG: hypothetical protein ABGW99_18755 [Zunongwangia sp.]|uniref:hypothetical protein n=1 Tax=Zunongwangia TaxID=417127 RepID=UPI0030D84E68